MEFYQPRPNGNFALSLFEITVPGLPRNNREPSIVAISGFVVLKIRDNCSTTTLKLLSPRTKDTASFLMAPR